MDYLWNAYNHLKITFKAWIRFKIHWLSQYGWRHQYFYQIIMYIVMPLLLKNEFRGDVYWWKDLLPLVRDNLQKDSLYNSNRIDFIIFFVIIQHQYNLLRLFYNTWLLQEFNLVYNVHFLLLYILLNPCFG